MSGHTIALGFHVAAGSAGLVLGPVAMFVGKRRGTHTRVGEAYHWVFAGRGHRFERAVAGASVNGQTTRGVRHE